MTTSLDDPSVAAAADALAHARASRTALPPFTTTQPDLDGEWGYAVQALDRARRVAAGERVVGAKLGLTSEAKQRTMRVHQPIAGFLTAQMQVAPGDTVDVSRWLQPRFEPEIAFVLSRDLDRALDIDMLPTYIESVAVAAEIIDSRFAGYRFAHADVVADNTSAAGFVVGEGRHLTEGGDLASLRCVLSVDGAEVDSADGAAILGHPLRSLVWLSEHLARRGEVVACGSVVMAGSMTDAVPLSGGSRFRAAVQGLGEVEIAVATDGSRAAD